MQSPIGTQVAGHDDPTTVGTIEGYVDGEQTEGRTVLVRWNRHAWSYEYANELMQPEGR